MSQLTLNLVVYYAQAAFFTVILMGFAVVCWCLGRLLWMLFKEGRVE